MAEHILSERRGDVLVLTLNRPDRLNAAPPAMFEEIAAAVATMPPHHQFIDRHCKALVA